MHLFWLAAANSRRRAAAPYRYAKAGKHNIAMYTYGQPRVGNSAFADAFNARVKSSWRFYNTDDIVPSVPRLMGYCHVKTGERLAQPEAAC